MVDAADTTDALSRLMDGLQECRPKRLILVLGSPGGADPAQRPFMGEIAHYKAGLSPPFPPFSLATMPAGCQRDPCHRALEGALLDRDGRC